MNLTKCIVTKKHLLDCQGCFLKGCTDEEAEELINATNPTGIDSRWKMKKTGNPYLKAPERVQCEMDTGREHITFEC